MFAAPIVSWTYGEGFAGAVVPLVWTGIGLVPTLVNGGRKVYLYASGLEGVAVQMERGRARAAGGGVCGADPVVWRGRRGGGLAAGRGGGLVAPTQGWRKAG